MELSFYLRDSNSKAETTIILYVRAGRSKARTKNTVKISTGLRIRPALWNQAKEAPRKGTDGEAIINERLKTIKARASQIWTQLQNQENKTSISLTEFGQQVREMVSIKPILEFAYNPRENFYDDFTRFIDSLKSEKATSTIRKYSTLLSQLKDTEPSLTYSKVDLDFYDRIKHYWLNTQGMTNTSVNKNFKLLKTFMKWAFERDLTNNDSFKRFKLIQQHEPNVFALSRMEFDQLYNAAIMSEHLKRVRDVFCFACLTGQRWSDYSKLTWDDISVDRWHLTQEKTKKKTIIPLLPLALQILQKYKEQDRPLPIISGQKTNMHLKELGKLMGWIEPVVFVTLKGSQNQKVTKQKWELLSTHIARKTFITIGLTNGMSPTEIMAISGHKTYASMKPYILITSDHAEKSLQSAWAK